MRLRKRLLLGCQCFGQRRSTRAQHFGLLRQLVAHAGQHGRLRGLVGQRGFGDRRPSLVAEELLVQLTLNLVQFQQKRFVLVLKL